MSMADTIRELQWELERASDERDELVDDINQLGHELEEAANALAKLTKELEDAENALAVMTKERDNAMSASSLMAQGIRDLEAMRIACHGLTEPVCPICGDDAERTVCAGCSPRIED